MYLPIDHYYSICSKSAADIYSHVWVHRGFANTAVTVFSADAISQCYLAPVLVEMSATQKSTFCLQKKNMTMNRFLVIMQSIFIFLI